MHGKLYPPAQPKHELSFADSEFLQIGYDSAFIGTTLALPAFTKEFGFAKLSPEKLALTKANIVSVYQAGAFFGSFGAYASSHFIGRRKSLIAWILVFIVGAGMMLGANGHRGLGLIIGGRVLAGIGVGAASNMVPIYISEMAPPSCSWTTRRNLRDGLADWRPRRILDQLWSYRDYATLSQAMDHSIRGTADPRRPSIDGCCLAQGVSKMVVPERTT